jgi:hypothetical protein
MPKLIVLAPLLCDFTITLIRSILISLECLPSSDFSFAMSLFDNYKTSSEMLETPPRNILSKHRNILLPIFTNLYKEAKCYWEHIGNPLGT